MIHCAGSLGLLALASCGRTGLSSVPGDGGPSTEIPSPCDWYVDPPVSIFTGGTPCSLSAAVDEDRYEAVLTWSTCDGPATHHAALVVLGGDRPFVIAQIETTERTWDVASRGDNWLFAETARIVTRDRGLHEVRNASHPLGPALSLVDADPGILLGLERDRWMAWSIDDEAIVSGPFGEAGWWATFVPGQGWFAVSPDSVIEQPLEGSERAQRLPDEVMLAGLTDDPSRRGVVVALWREPPGSGLRVTRGSVASGLGGDLADLSRAYSPPATTDAEILLVAGPDPFQPELRSIPLDGSAARTIALPETPEANEFVVVADKATAAVAGRDESKGVWVRGLRCSR